MPRSNAGNFRGLFALNETGKNDYTTGFNLDMTGEASAALDHVNVEGKGFGGAVNLCRASHPLRSFQTLAEATIDANREMQIALKGSDFREGVASFMEKRPPRFTGK